MTRLFILSILSLILVACNSEFTPQNGDLVFRVGNTDFSSAIKSATSRDKDIPYTHVGIVWVHGDTISIIEAGDTAVSVTPYGQFINAAMRDGDRLFATVSRVDIDRELRDAAVGRALTFLGQPYDNAFTIDNGMMYCTELVWEAYLDASGNRIFPASPMNFYAADGTLNPYWVKHFEALGIDIPQGEPGTNPVDMSKDPHITPIHYYF